MIIIIINDDLVLRDALRGVNWDLSNYMDSFSFVSFFDVFFTKRFIGYALRSHGEIQVQTPE